MCDKPEYLFRFFCALNQAYFYLYTSFNAMKIRFILSFFFSLGVLGAISQETRIAVLNEVQGFQSTTVRFELGNYSFKEVNTAQGTAMIPVIAGSSQLLLKGVPDLPKFTRSFMVPDHGEIFVQIQEADFTEIQNIRIAPSIGNLSRTENPANFLRTNGAQYLENTFFPAGEVELREPYILSGARGVTLLFQPFRYNPVTHTLRIYHEITATIGCRSEVQGINERSESVPRIPLVEDHQIQQKHFLNFPVDRYEVPANWGKMLIISHPEFMSAMQPFIAWKKATGMQVDMISYASLGSEQAIYDEVAQRYTDGLKYIVLVGDIDQIPSPTKNGGKSDPSYGYVEGNDSYPEVFIGRFSAESIADVQIQVQKVLLYEQAVSGNHYANVTGIASDQGPGDDDELDYEHIRNMEADLLGFTYTSSHEFFDGSQQDQDAPGNPTADDVASAIDAGTGLILYTGHGSSESFSSSEFSNADIAQLDNGSKLPVIWSVACVNGEFDNGTCFGEAWLRARQGNTPTGAATVFMSSINQSWNPPMSAQDEMVDILAGLHLSNQGRTFGSISLSGCMLMNDEYGAAGSEMTDSWHIFGDPSLLIRTKAPQILEVTHTSSLIIGESSVTVYSDAENARIALMQGGTILATGLISGGSCILEFEPLSSVALIQVTGTAFNYTPYLGSIEVQPPNAPYLVYEQSEIIDQVGNNNALADYNETIQLNITAQNIGLPFQANITGTISENSPWVNLSNPDLICNFIMQNEDQFISNGCFEFTVVDGVPDQTQVVFLVTLNDENGNSWNVNVPVMLHAPVMQVSTYELEEITGNNNGRPDPGELIRIILTNQNIGSSESIIGTPSLTFTSDLLQEQANSGTIGSVIPQQNETASFDLMISPSYPSSTTEAFQYTANFGAYSATYNFELLIGAIIEDAESSGFTQFPWNNASDSPWFIDENNSFEGDQSFRSGSISDNEQTELMLNYVVSSPGEISFHRAVSSEDGYDFLKFYIDGELMDQWSGSLNWAEFSYPVSAGEHNFSWVYSKDEVFSSNSDAAWVDFIVLPPSENNTFLPSVENKTFVCFPNPAQSTIQLMGLKQGAYTCNWMDLSGRIVNTQQVKVNEQGPWQLDVPDRLSNGLYLLQFQSGDELHSVSISIQR